MTVVGVILALGFSFLQGLALSLFCIEGLDGIEKLIRIIVDLELIVAILMDFHFLFVKTQEGTDEGDVIGPPCFRYWVWSSRFSFMMTSEWHSRATFSMMPMVT